MRNYDSEERQSFAHRLAAEIRFVKEQQKNDKLIILGDFNMNPYERGMNLAAGLNAMMTKKCVQSGTRRHLGEDFDLYYNPMWSLFGDIPDGPAGTVYDTSSQGPYGWSMLDQVLLNYSVVGLFADVTILTASGPYSLMDTNGRPDSQNASDHFPIMLTLSKEIMND
jgi:exonuclease III